MSWCGASSISIRKVSMGVSPISLKKNRCSRHFRPMERSAGRRRRSFANLDDGEKDENRVTDLWLWLLLTHRHC